MLEHLKWNLWHGKVDRALEIIDELAYALDVEDGSPEHRKLLKAVRAFETYVTNHRAFIPNYGERYRQRNAISTGFTESAVNQVVSKRMVKKQQMRWSERRPPLTPNSDPGVERGLALHPFAMVSRNE